VAEADDQVLDALVRCPRRSQILQLREKLMEGAPQPTLIVRPRPSHGSPMEGVRDQVLDGACGSFYYRVTTVL